MDASYTATEAGGVPPGATELHNFPQPPANNGADGEAGGGDNADAETASTDVLPVVKIVPNDTDTFSHVIQTKQLSRPAQLMRLSEMDADDHYIHYTVMAGVITQWALACLGRKWADYCPSGRAVKWFYRVVVGAFVLVGFALAMALIGNARDAGDACCVEKDETFESCAAVRADNSSILENCAEEAHALFAGSYCGIEQTTPRFNYYARPGIEKDHPLIARVFFGVFDWLLTGFDVFAPKRWKRPNTPIMALFKFCALISTIALNKDMLPTSQVTDCGYFRDRYYSVDPRYYQYCLSWTELCGENIEWRHDFANRPVYAAAAEASLVVLLLEAVLQGISYVGRMQWVRGVGLVV